MSEQKLAATPTSRSSYAFLSAGALAQYDVVTKSVLGLAGQRRPRTERSMHAATPLLAGPVLTVKPIGTPIFPASRVGPFMASGAPQEFMKQPRASGRGSAAVV